MGREIFYDEKAYLKITDLGFDIHRLDDRMAIVEWGLWLGAEEFPLIDLDGAPNLRVARVEREGDEPPLRVYFRIDSDTAVTVLWIEPVE